MLARLRWRAEAGWSPSGQNQVVPSTVAIPQIKSGRLRALAIVSAHRSALFPELPTIAEAGFPKSTALSWYALHAPAGTPAEAVRKLSAAMEQATAAAPLTGAEDIPGAQLSATVTVTATDISADAAGQKFVRGSGSWIADGFTVGISVFAGGWTGGAGGCTSGHGICGMGSLQLPSFLAVLTFLVTAIATAQLLRAIGIA